MNLECKRVVPAWWTPANMTACAMMCTCVPLPVSQVKSMSGKAEGTSAEGTLATDSRTSAQWTHVSPSCGFSDDPVGTRPAFSHGRFTNGAAWGGAGQDTITERPGHWRGEGQAALPHRAGNAESAQGAQHAQRSVASMAVSLGISTLPAMRISR